MSSCPNCGAPEVELVKVDAGLKLHMKSLPEYETRAVPDSVCAGCHNQFSSSLSQGAILRQQQAAKEQSRIMLWRTRVQLVKQAKALMAAKQFSEAAVSYEKYLRVLEIVHDKKSGELTPELFKNAARQQEMTVIASVYWDLMRIYDTNPRYADRQLKAAEKLAEFARFTPIYSNVVRKAEGYIRSAKNPQMYKRFLTLSNQKRPRCFISTAAFNHQTSSTVIELCQFRDQYLVHRKWGRKFVLTYYRHSPRIAQALDQNPQLKPAVRALLQLAATCVRRLSA